MIYTLNIIMYSHYSVMLFQEPSKITNCVYYYEFFYMIPGMIDQQTKATKIVKMIRV